MRTIHSIFRITWLLFQLEHRPATSITSATGTSTFSKWLKIYNREKVTGLEVTLIFLLCFALAGHHPPDVNESHYLTKAKHFWNPDWCPEDLFLSSSNSHWLFYVCFGWITKWTSLETFAWIGRIGTWLGFAYAWYRLNRILNFAPLISVFTFGLFFLFNQRFNLAGEWVVGGFEAKSAAYVLLLFALGEILLRRWKWVWLAVGCAAALHPLVGCWALLASGWVWLVDRRNELQFRLRRSVTGKEWIGDIRLGLRSQWGWLATSILLVAFGAYWPLAADWNTDPRVAAVADEVYVNHRLAHHLIFSAFPVGNIARFTTLTIIWWLLAKWCLQNWKSYTRAFGKIHAFGIASLLISLIGLWLSAISDSSANQGEWATRLLKYYWFRLADFAIPFAASLTLGRIVSGWIVDGTQRARQIAAAVAMVLIGAACVSLVVERFSDPRPVADQRSLPKFPEQPDKARQYHQKWKQVCHWIALQTPREAKFITPFQQQTFKWYSGRTEIVNWKDIPQDAASILQWRQRFDDLILPQQQLELGLMSYPDAQLIALAKKHNAQYLVVPQWQVDQAGPSVLKQVYPDSTRVKSGFVVLQFDSAAVDRTPN
jgi:hypothetical protein